MQDIHSAIDAVWRMASARLIASLAQVVRDVGLAEELAHHPNEPARACEDRAAMRTGCVLSRAG